MSLARCRRGAGTLFPVNHRRCSLATGETISKYQARDIYRALTRVLPRDHVFMDIDTIVPGENFVRTLEEWVERCDIVLALIGNGWVTAADPKTGGPRLHNPQDFGADRDP